MPRLPISSFFDELEKIAIFDSIGGVRGAWERLTSVFSPEKKKAIRRVDYHFSDKAGPEKWDKFKNRVRDPEFVRQLGFHPQADDTLKMHAEEMHALSKGKPVGKMPSDRLVGKTYEIRKLPSGRVGCTCNDWRYKASVNPGYDCKHVRRFKLQEQQ